MQKRKIWKRRRRGWSIYVEWSFELQWEEQGWWRRSCKFVKINFYASKPSIFKTYYYKIITALIYHYVFGPAPLRTEFWSARWRCSKLGVWWEHSWLLLALQESLTGQGQPVIRNWNQNQLMMNDMEDVTNLHHSARIIRKYVEFRIRHGSSVHLSTKDSARLAATHHHHMARFIYPSLFFFHTLFFRSSACKKQSRLP
jgi:hypothetical protein